MPRDKYLMPYIFLSTNSLAPPASNKKLDQKQVPRSSAGKPKQQIRGKKTVKSNTGCAVKEKSQEVDSEMFPDIEIMSTKQEEDECK